MSTGKNSINNSDSAHLFSTRDLQNIDTFGGKIANFAHSQRLVLNLLVIFVIFVGLFVYTNVIRKELLPEIKLGLIVINTYNPGTSAADIEKDITIQIENKVKGLEGVDYIESVSSEANSIVLVHLEAGVDEKETLLDIKAEVNKIDLPENVETPDMRDIQISVPVVEFSICVCDGYYTELTEEQRELKLKKYAENLRDELLNFYQVDEVSIIGLRDRVFYIDVNPLKLAQHGLDMPALAGMVASGNSRVSSGKIDVLNEEVLIRAGEKFTDSDKPLEQIRRIIIKTTEEGSGVRLDKTADVYESLEEMITHSKVYKIDPATLSIPAKTSDSLAVQVFKKDKADAVRLSERMREFVETFNAELPPGVNVTMYRDSSEEIIDRNKIVEENALIGFILVMILLMMFMNYRFAFMTALGIPISMCGTIIIMYALGISANVLSIFGLIIALGLVVDDAIIISENSYRFLEKGYSPRRAAVFGLSEVAAPVVASVLTTIAAFAPLLFLGGVFGQFMRPIPAVVIIALGVSLVEAFLILPVHVVDWAPTMREKGQAEKSESFFGQLFDFLFGWAEYLRFRVNMLFLIVREDYLDKMRLILRWRYAFLLFMLILAGFVGNIFMTMPKGFVNWAQVNEFGVTLELPKGSSFEQTEQMLAVVEQEVFATIPKYGIDSLSVMIGQKQAADRSVVVGKNVGMLKVTLISQDKYAKIVGNKPPEDFKNRENVENYLSNLRRKLSKLPVKNIETIVYEGGPSVGKDIELRISGKDIKVLQEISKTIRTRLDRIPGIYDIVDDLEVGNEEIKVDINEEKAKLNGFDKLSLASTIQAAFDGITATTLTIGEDDVDVVIRYQEKYRRNVADLLAINLKTPSGEEIPLKNLVKIERKTGTAYIRRYERKRTVTIYGQVSGMSASEGSARAKAAVDEVLLNYPGYNLVVTGSTVEQQDTFRNLGYAMMITFFLIFIILAAVLKSVIQPMLIMAIIPFGFLGSVLGLFITGSVFTLNAGIGAVALLGIVVNDTTVLVTFINKNRQSGNSKWKSILTAGKNRMRPILLTTFTTIGGLFGIAVGFGTKTFLADLAISIIGGLLFATLLTLAFVPVLYAIYEDILGLFKRKRRSKKEKVDAKEYKRMLATLRFSMSQDEKSSLRSDVLRKIQDNLDSDTDIKSSDDFEV